MAALLFVIIFILKLNGNELRCQVNNTLMDDILSTFIDMGYTVNNGVLTYATERIYPFVNPHSGYGSVYFESSQTEVVRLSGSDAIIIHVCTPPNAVYYSYRSYLAAKLNAEGIDEMLSSLGDSINHLNINTDGDGTDGGHFDQLTTIVITGDNQTWTNVSDVFRVYGLDDTMNLQTIPNDYFVWSMNAFELPRDTLAVISRIVDPLDDELFYKYVNQSWNIHILSRNDVPNADPVIPFDIDIKDTTMDYNEYSENNEEMLNKVVNEVRNSIENMGYEWIETFDLVSEYGFTSILNQGAFIFEHGFWCIDNNVNCIGDNRDTVYSWNTKERYLNDDDYFIFIGMNHYYFNLSVYDSIGIYKVRDDSEIEYNEFTAIISMTNFDYQNYKISNSGFIDINQYSNYDVDNKIFMVQLKRNDDCNDSPATLCVNNVNMLDYSTSFVIMGRATLNPTTTTMPNRNQLIPWKVLHFKSNKTDTSQFDWIFYIIIPVSGLIVLITIAVLFKKYIFCTKKSEELTQLM